LALLPSRGGDYLNLSIGKFILLSITATVLLILLNCVYDIKLCLSRFTVRILSM
jgi:hypothetical protein